MLAEWTLISERFTGQWVVRMSTNSWTVLPLIERSYFRAGKKNDEHELISKLEYGESITFPNVLANDDNKEINIGSLYHVSKLAGESLKMVGEIMPEPKLMKPLSWAKLIEESKKKKTTTKTKK